MFTYKDKNGNRARNTEPLFIETYRQISWNLDAWEIRIYTFPIAEKFDRHLSSSTAWVPVKLQKDTIFITYNLAASRLLEIWW